MTYCTTCHQDSEQCKQASAPGCQYAHSQGIRSYGLTKFQTILDQYVYQVSLDGGCDDEIGSSDWGSWYGLMRHGRTIFRDHDPFLETLNQAEQEKLTGSAGVILREDSDGFVAVHYFQDEKNLDAAWADVVNTVPVDAEEEGAL